MDLKLFLSAFATVFVAELGDKTQLAALSLSAGSGKPWTVLLASTAALVASSVLAVIAGTYLARWLDPVWINRSAGVLFIVLGILTLWKSFGGPASA